MRVFSAFCTCIDSVSLFLEESLMKFHWPLYSDIIFFVEHYSAWVSNKHCLLLFSLGIVSFK